MTLSAPVIRLRLLPALLPTDGRNIELRQADDFIQWRYEGDADWTNLVPLSDITGPAGPNVELRVDGEYIQWRVVGTADWTNLLPLADITGLTGDPGPPGPQGPPVELTPQMYGATGDGSTDDTVALQDAIDAAIALGQPLQLGGVNYTYAITAKLEGGSNLVLRGNGAVIDMSGITTGALHGLVIEGALGASSNLGSNAAIGAYSVAVANGALFTAGEWVLVHSETEYVPYGSGSYNVARGEWRQIRSIATNTLNLTEPLDDSYTTAGGGKVHKCDFAQNFRLEGVRIRGSNTANSQEQGICIRYAKDFHVEGCEVAGVDWYAYEISSSIWFIVTNNKGRGVYYDGTTGSIFYGFALLNSCQNFLVVNNLGSTFRHLVVATARDAGQGHYGRPMHYSVSGNLLEDAMAGGVGRSYVCECRADTQHGVWSNNNAGAGCMAFMRFDGAQHIQVHGGGCAAYAYEGLIFGGAGTTCRDITIDGVHLTRYTGEVTSTLPAAVRLDGSDVMEAIHVLNVQAPACSVSNGGVAISIGSSTTMRDIAFKGGSYRSGASESTTTAVALANGVPKVLFEGLDIFGYRGGYAVANSPSVVKGGSVRNFATGATGFGFTTTATRAILDGVHFDYINTPISLLAGSANCLATRNTWSNNTGTISDAGTSNVTTGNNTV